MNLKTKQLSLIIAIFSTFTIACSSSDEEEIIEPVDPCADVVKDNSIISDFECQQNFFIGADATKETQAPAIDNTNKSGINSSDKVGKFIDDGSQAWDNLLVDFGSAYNLTDRSQLKIKVFAPKAGNLIAKLEGGSSAVEQDFQIEKINEWVECSFNFREAIDMGNTKLVLFFNAGADNGTSEEIYLIDDIRFVINDFPIVADPCEGVEKDMSIISDFECQHNYTFTGRLEAGIDNLYKAGINQSEKIGEFTDDGTNAWDFLLVDYGKAIDLSTKNKLKLMIHSDKAVQFLAKLEGGTSAAHEIWMDITTTGEWVEYTVDFSSQANENHNKVVLFFNAGKDDGGATDKYYLDNIRWE